MLKKAVDRIKHKVQRQHFATDAKQDEGHGIEEKLHGFF